MRWMLASIAARVVASACLSTSSRRMLVMICRLFLTR
jgi:hypothetical protein